MNENTSIFSILSREKAPLIVKNEIPLPAPENAEEICKKLLNVNNPFDQNYFQRLLELIPTLSSQEQRALLLIKNEQGLTLTDKLLTTGFVDLWWKILSKLNLEAEELYQGLIYSTSEGKFSMEWLVYWENHYHEKSNSSFQIQINPLTSKITLFFSLVSRLCDSRINTSKILNLLISSISIIQLPNGFLFFKNFFNKIFSTDSLLQEKFLEWLFTEKTDSNFKFSSVLMRLMEQKDNQSIAIYFDFLTDCSKTAPELVLAFLANKDLLKALLHHQNAMLLDIYFKFLLDLYEETQKYGLTIPVNKPLTGILLMEVPNISLETIDVYLNLLKKLFPQDYLGTLFNLAEHAILKSINEPYFLCLSKLLIPLSYPEQFILLQTKNDENLTLGKRVLKKGFVAQYWELLNQTTLLPKDLYLLLMDANLEGNYSMAWYIKKLRESNNIKQPRPFIVQQITFYFSLVTRLIDAQINIKEIITLLKFSLFAVELYPEGADGLMECIQKTFKLDSSNPEWDLLWDFFQYQNLSRDTLGILLTKSMHSKSPKPVQLYLKFLEQLAQHMGAYKILMILGVRSSASFTESLLLNGEAQIIKTFINFLYDLSQKINKNHLGIIADFFILSNSLQSYGEKLLSLYGQSIDLVIAYLELLKVLFPIHANVYRKELIQVLTQALMRPSLQKLIPLFMPDLRKIYNDYISYSPKRKRKLGLLLPILIPSTTLVKQLFENEIPYSEVFRSNPSLPLVMNIISYGLEQNKVPFLQSIISSIDPKHTESLIIKFSDLKQYATVDFLIKCINSPKFDRVKFFFDKGRFTDIKLLLMRDRDPPILEQIAFLDLYKSNPKKTKYLLSTLTLSAEQWSVIHNTFPLNKDLIDINLSYAIARYGLENNQISFWTDPLLRILLLQGSHSTYNLIPDIICLIGSFLTSLPLSDVWKLYVNFSLHFVDPLKYKKQLKPQLFTELTESKNTNVEESLPSVDLNLDEYIKEEKLFFIQKKSTKIPFFGLTTSSEDQKVDVTEFKYS